MLLQNTKKNHQKWTQVSTHSKSNKLPTYTDIFWSSHLGILHDKNCLWRASTNRVHGWKSRFSGNWWPSMLSKSRVGDEFPRSEMKWLARHRVSVKQHEKMEVSLDCWSLSEKYSNKTWLTVEAQIFWSGERACPSHSSDWTVWQVGA